VSGRQRRRNFGNASRRGDGICPWLPNGLLEQVYEHVDCPDFNPEASPLPALPPGLAEMAPGPELGRLLSELDSIPLSGYERAVLVAAHRRMVSYHQAEGYRQIAFLYDDCVELCGQPEEGVWAATTAPATIETVLCRTHGVPAGGIRGGTFAFGHIFEDLGIGDPADDDLEPPTIAGSRPSKGRSSR